MVTKLIDMTKLGLESSVMDVLSTILLHCILSNRMSVAETRRRRNKGAFTSLEHLEMTPAWPGWEGAQHHAGATGIFFSRQPATKPLEMLVHGGWDRARVDGRLACNCIVYSDSNCHSGSWIGLAFWAQRGEKVWYLHDYTTSCVLLRAQCDSWEGVKNGDTQVRLYIIPLFAISSSTRERVLL